MTLTILIPCHNEANAIASVIDNFRREFPSAEIVVVDNASTDDTAKISINTGARVIVEPRKGKANAIRTAFELIKSDATIMVDGDGSYPTTGARILWNSFLNDPADMLVGVRSSVDNQGAFRPLHQFGSNAFAFITQIAFGYHTKDIFSGLRLFSKRFIFHIPILSQGFELEMDLTIQAIDKGMRIRELTVPFTHRHQGTYSKLRTFRDGWAILHFLGVLCRDYKPLVSFGTIAAFFAMVSLAVGSLPVLEYLETGLVGRFPLAILASGLGILSFLFLTIGITLESSLRHHRESFQLRLRQPVN